MGVVEGEVGLLYDDHFGDIWRMIILFRFAEISGYPLVVEIDCGVYTL